MLPRLLLLLLLLLNKLHPEVDDVDEELKCSLLASGDVVIVADAGRFVGDLERDDHDEDADDCLAIFSSRISRCSRFMVLFISTDRLRKVSGSSIRFSLPMEILSTRRRSSLCFSFGVHRSSLLTPDAGLQHSSEDDSVLSSSASSCGS